MQNIFIINQKAGKGQLPERFLQDIEKAKEQLGANADVYYTKGIGDAEIFSRKFCEDHKDEELRFFACGGDGTLNEVLNGTIAFKNTSVGVVPTGTGNDFCRNFSASGNFMSPIDQLNGKSIKCDAIKFTTELNGKLCTRYCANMFNIGFDCNVVDMTAKMKTKPLISGSFAYLLSVLIILIGKKGADLKIEADGELCHNGPLLLTSVANGAFCGGGIKSNPRAEVTDGMIDINIIKNVSRIKFLTLFPSYQKGTHLEVENIEEILTSKKCKKLTITPNLGTMRLCTDGEITEAGKTEFEIAHNAFNMSVPCSL